MRHQTVSSPIIFPHSGTSHRPWNLGWRPSLLGWRLWPRLLIRFPQRSSKNPAARYLAALHPGLKARREGRLQHGLFRIFRGVAGSIAEAFQVQHTLCGDLIWTVSTDLQTMKSTPGSRYFLHPLGLLAISKVFMWA